MTRYHLQFFPVVLGAGQRLFDDGGLPTSFELTGSATTESGIAMHTYRLTGRASYAFALDE
ncbi:hypothetical protein GCM10009730_15980 [Streptomyces albidochromogenes]|uniref:dihydrofolate reductase family protein n=1 Tax=Streptomyces albidochromogenes TaxID=329524 RepID=UPI001ABF1BE8|nr:dihydrofolate reductase family protein [Streptomyces albidochromogenes]